MAVSGGSGTILLRRPLPPLQKQDKVANEKSKKKKNLAAENDTKTEQVISHKLQEQRRNKKNNILNDSAKESHQRLELLFLNQKPRGADSFPFRSPKKPLQIDLNAFIDDSYEPPPPIFELDDFILKPEEGRGEKSGDKRQMHIIEKPLTQWHIYTKNENVTQKIENIEFSRIALDEDVDLPNVQQRIPFRQKLIEEKAYNLEMYSDEYFEKLKKAFGSKARSRLAVVRPTYVAQSKKLFVGEDGALYESSFDDECTMYSRESLSQIAKRAVRGQIAADSPSYSSHENKIEDGEFDQELFLVHSPPLFFQGERSARSPSPFDPAEGEAVGSGELAVLESLAHGGTKLVLKAHFIDRLPDISSLSTTLVHINLSFNYFTDMPEELFEIPQIETLKLRNNPIQEIPSGIQKLKYLKTLVLSFCCISSLPQSLFQLGSLQKLDLSYNRIAFISDELRNLRNLKILNLEGNQLTSLPRGIILLNLNLLKVANNFMHPLLWKLAAPPQPQHLLESCATFLAQKNLHLNIHIKDVKLNSFMKSLSPCDFCGGPKFGQGLRVIKPAAELFGVNNLPILFYVCSQNCRSILRGSTEISLFPE